MRRLATVALVGLCMMVFAPTASAAPPTVVGGSDYLVQPGQTITFSSLTIESCNSLVAGVNRQGAGVEEISLANNTGSECTAVTFGPISFTNDTGSDQTFRLWLQDNTCSNIYYADGNHAKVFRKRAAINDAGPGCEVEFEPARPKGKSANLTVDVSVE